MKNLVVSRLWAQSAGFRVRYFGAIAALGAATGLAFVVPLVIRSAVDRTLAGEAPASRLVLDAGLIVGLTGLAGVFTYLRGRWSAWASEGIVRGLRERIFGHLQQLPAAYFDGQETGDLIQRCSSDVDTMRRFLAVQVVEIGRTVIIVLIALPIMLSLHRGLAAVSVMLIPPILVFAIWFFHRIRTSFRSADEAEGAMTAALQENLSGVRVVWAFGRSDLERRRFGTRAANFRDRSIEVTSLMARYWASSDFVCLLQLGVTLFVGGGWTASGQLSPGTFVAFLTYVNLMIWPIRHLGRVLTDLGKASVAMERIWEVLDQPTEIGGRSWVPPVTGGLSIDFDRVRFAYGAGTPVLDNLSFHVDAGETVAIVGAPGAGKSTLVRLLLGLYRADSGEIRLGSMPIDRLDRRDLRRCVRCVLQDGFLYSRTVGENIAMARERAEAAEIYAAAKEACVHENIVSFRDGYATSVGERGVTLSGGQRQRICLSRAFLSESPVLILDDALSAVDNQTEERIRVALEKRRGRQTTLIVAHRFSTVALADRVIVVGGGRVLETGSHDMLLARNGPYAELWRREYDSRLVAAG